MKRLPPTPRQQDALTYIKWHISEHSGVPPTYREIARGIHTTYQSAHDLVAGLEERGWVTTVIGKTRSISLTKDDDLLSFLPVHLRYRVKAEALRAGDKELNVVIDAIDSYFYTQPSKRTANVTSANL